MTATRRCFSNVKVLRRLNPALLRDVLGKFPDHLREYGLRLPAQPTEENLDYELIAKVCMAGDIPEELDDVLSYSSALGNSAGWELIQQEAKAQRKPLPFSANGLSCPDLAMKAWLHDWPRNQNLLEEAYSRARIHGKSAYVYYPPAKDVRPRFATPTIAKMKQLRKELDKYFIEEGLGKGTNVLMFDFECEVWFLIRYPGHLTRQGVFEDNGTTTSLTFRPEEYDAVVYHKKFGDLRVNTNRKREHRKYRILFGHLLLGTENVFMEEKRVIGLEPLKGECVDLFDCEDIEGLAEIAPAEVSFHGIVDPTRKILWREDKGSTLLGSNRLGKHLLPADTDTVHHAVFKYRLKNRTKFDTLTVHQGNSMTYERDGDSPVLEQWLRARGFVINTLDRKRNEPIALVAVG